MSEQEEKRITEDNIRAVGLWVVSFMRGEVGEVDVQVLKSALVEVGANFEVEGEALKSLGQYTNKSKRPGLDAVWGKDRVEEYRAWLKTWVYDFEEEAGTPLPALKRSGSKISGMLQFFGELTAIAAGQMTFEDFKRFEEARQLNGLYWLFANDKRVRIKVPTAEKPIRPSSYPPGFPTHAWRYIKSWKVDSSEN